jgi:hypothetical protein
MTRALKVQSARDLGPLFTDNRHQIVGQDGAFSIPLPGRTLWFFGDTLIGRRRKGQSLWFIDGKSVGPRDMSGRGGIDRMINNCGLLVPAGRGSDVLRQYQYILDATRRVKTLLPLEADEHPDRDRIWCQHGHLAGSKLFLSFIKVRMLDEPTPPLPLGFEIVGSGLAVGSSDTWEFTRITRHGNSILWGADQPHFATALLRSPEDDFVYLYGTVKRGERQQCYLARSRPDALQQIESYQYFVAPGPEWGGDVNAAARLFDSMPSELSVSYNAHVGGYLAVHSLDLTGKLVGRVAPHPWGPWSGPTLLWTAQVKHETPPPYPTLVYAGKEHPELASADGRTIYLTYVEFEEYFPRLVEVTLQ